MQELQFLDSRSLFTLFSALNRNGYDLEGNPTMHPVRLWLRKRVAGLSTEPYFQRALPGWPRAGWLASTLFCLNNVYGWRCDPEPMWDEIAWESPEPVDADARAWLRQLPKELRRWEAQLITLSDSLGQSLWQQYCEQIRQHEPTGVREQISAQVEQRLAGSPFRVTRPLVVVPNYLQSDWSTDPVHVDGQIYIITGPLSLRTVGGIVHEVIHETFAPLLTPVRDWLGGHIGILAGDRPLLEKWGYWNADPNRTVYKVVEECCVRAASEWLKGSGPDDEWGNYGLGLARTVHAHFVDHGLFQDSGAVLRFLGQLSR